MPHVRDVTRVQVRGVLIVRDVHGIVRFDDWDGLPDETQRMFREHLTEYEREIFPLRRQVRVTLDRGHNGFPIIAGWDDLTLDEQEAYHAQMTQSEREYYPLKEAVRWVHPLNPDLPRKRTRADAYS